MAYDIYEHIQREYLIPFAEQVEPGRIESLIANDASMLDMVNARIYIPDLGDGGETLYGVMVADLSLDEIDEGYDLAQWALENIPAPGTGAANRMDLITVEQAVEDIVSRPADFAMVAC